MCRYNLKPDVRGSLYDCCNQWVEAVGCDRQFMGGATPNLADLVRLKHYAITEKIVDFAQICELSMKFFSAKPSRETVHYFSVLHNNEGKGVH